MSEDFVLVRRSVLLQLVGHAKGLNGVFNNLEIGFRHAKGLTKLFDDLEFLAHRPTEDLTAPTKSDSR